MSEVVERRTASIVVARVVRPKFVPKHRELGVQALPRRRRPTPGRMMLTPKLRVAPMPMPET